MKLLRGEHFQFGQSFYSKTPYTSFEYHVKLWYTAVSNELTM